eukprot:2586721-Pleurochrysis_carterae.AAC.3
MCLIRLETSAWFAGCVATAALSFSGSLVSSDRGERLGGQDGPLLLLRARMGETRSPLACACARVGACVRECVRAHA